MPRARRPVKRGRHQYTGSARGVRGCAGARRAVALGTPTSSPAPVRLLASAILALLLTAPAARAQAVQYRSRAGVEHRAQADTGAIARAEAALALAPGNVDRIIALGLAQAAVRQYREAIATFSRGIAVAPANPALYRWRGHRYISIGDPGRALADLETGNRLDTLNYDIWYHLGVAHFLRGEFPAAADAFAHCQRLAPNANEVAGATDWLWMSLSRAGRDAEARQALAPITDDFRVTTATAYFQRLQLYRGKRTPDQVLALADTAPVQVATLSFGVGNWYLVQGDRANARKWFERGVASGGWPGFGYFASEIELQRLK